LSGQTSEPILALLAPGPLASTPAHAADDTLPQSIQQLRRAPPGVVIQPIAPVIAPVLRTKRPTPGQRCCQRASISHKPALTPPSGPQPPGPQNQPPGSGTSTTLPPSAPPGPQASAGEPERPPRPEPSERPWNAADLQETLARIDQLDPSSLEEQELALRLIRQLVEQHLRTMERRPEDGDAPDR
jgi:hypothetical protein